MIRTARATLQDVIRIPAEVLEELTSEQICLAPTIVTRNKRTYSSLHGFTFHFISLHQDSTLNSFEQKGVIVQWVSGSMTPFVAKAYLLYLIVYNRFFSTN